MKRALSVLVLVLGCGGAQQAPDSTPQGAPRAARPEGAAFDCEEVDPSAESLAERMGPPASEFRKPGLEIYVFDVGQADSMLVVGPYPDRKTLLVDLGEPMRGDKTNYEHVAERIEQITRKREVDYLLVSHFHTDHVGTKKSGIAGLLTEVEPPFAVGTLIDIGDEGSDYIPSARGTWTTFDANAKEWVKEGGPVGRRVRPEFGTGSIDLGAGAIVEILAFAGRVSSADRGALAAVSGARPVHYDDAPASENDLSIAIEISYGEFEFFTAGDLSGGEEGNEFSVRRFGEKKQTYTNVEHHLVSHWRRSGRESDVEIYRANHHGSGHSSNAELIDILDPEFVLYSCGGDYGHPTPDVAERGAETARQFATTALDEGSWGSQSEFRALRGAVVGEIRISVAKSGQWYRVRREVHKAYSDSEENGDAGGMDVGEEDRS